MSVRGGPDISESGLVLYLDAANRRSYPGSGTAWNDLSGNNRNGTLTNGPTFSNTNGGIITFDGTNDIVEFGDILDLGTNSITVNAWVNFPSTLTDFGYVLTKALAGPQSYRFAFGFNTTRNMYVVVIGNSGDVISNTTTALDLNRWHMCTYVMNRSSNIQAYVNGELQTFAGSTTVSQWNGLDFQSSNPLRIGSYTGGNNIDAQNFFRGNMGPVQVYHRVLSAEEILQNFNATRSRFGI